MNTSELHPSRIPIHLDYKIKDRDIQVFKDYLYRKTKLTAEAQIDRLYISWQQIVGLYSTRKLTKERDRLVALEGISNTLQNMIGSRLASGLLIARIIQDLFWIPNVSNDQLPKSKLDWRALSWL